MQVDLHGAAPHTLTPSMQVNGPADPPNSLSVQVQVQVQVHTRKATHVPPSPSDFQRCTAESLRVFLRPQHDSQNDANVVRRLSQKGDPSAQNVENLAETTETETSRKDSGSR